MMLISRRKLLYLTVSAAVCPAASRAETYPSRPIRLVVGFTPGAASDVIARIFARGGSDFLGERIIVENKPGAGSSIAARSVARSAADGYTLFLVALSTLTNEIVHPASPPLKIGEAFSAVALLADGPYLLLAGPSLKVNSIAELVSWARAHPGEVLYGSVGAGSIPHLCAELFAQRAGIKLRHIPYPGSPQAVTDLIAGRISIYFTTAPSVSGQIASGQLKALAIAADRRSAALPRVPTMTEAGINDFKISLWLGLVAPAGTPRPIVERLAQAADRTMYAPDAVQALEKQGYGPLHTGPDQFATFISRETDKWTAVARNIGLVS